MTERGAPPRRLAALRGHLAAVFSPELYGGPAAPVWVQAALILACALIFGFQYVTFKSVFHAVGPWTLLTLRAVLSIPCMVWAMRWTRVPVATGRAELLRIALPAALLLRGHADPKGCAEDATGLGRTGKKDHGNDQSLLHFRLLSDG